MDEIFHLIKDYIFLVLHCGYIYQEVVVVIIIILSTNKSGKFKLQIFLGLQHTYRYQLS